LKNYKKKIAHATTKNLNSQATCPARGNASLVGNQAVVLSLIFLTIKVNIHLAIRKLAKHAVALGRTQALPCVFKTTKFTNL